MKLNPLSWLLRRTHLYLALFLSPWMLLYAFSTLAMNHREELRALLDGGGPRYERERELSYGGTLPDETEPRWVAEQLLSHLNLEGAYSVRREADSGRLVIFRHHPLQPRRITFSPADGRVKVEKEIFQLPVFLERLHRRRGYQHDSLGEDSWAFLVDLVIAGMLFWILSGLWMWWELRQTRRWGALCLLGGSTLFLFFLFSS